MELTKNTGTCFLCNQEIEHRSAVKHLHTCLEGTVSENNTKEKVFLFKVSEKSPNEKLFWLYVEINGSAKLEELDSFLRETWLECCGHMSEFTINNEHYTSDEEMDKVIFRLFEVETQFGYAYDFGSTTKLEGKIVSVRPGILQQGIRLIARNNLSESILCIVCDKEPSVICSACCEIFCDKCKNKQENCEGEEFMLPVVNSPRMGVCQR